MPLNMNRGRLFRRDSLGLNLSPSHFGDEGHPVLGLWLPAQRSQLVGSGPHTRAPEQDCPVVDLSRTLRSDAHHTRRLDGAESFQGFGCVSRLLHDFEFCGLAKVVAFLVVSETRLGSF